MKNLLIVLLTMVTTVMHAATTPRGNERLRELAVVPALNMTFAFNVQSSTFIEDLTEDGTREEWIEQARKKLKSDPDDLSTQVKLGRLLTVNDDTNAAIIAFEKAAALARQRLEQRPNDGATLVLMAQAAWGLDKEAEAEGFYRRATKVASNDWRGWLGLGNTLRDQALGNLGLTNSSKQESVQGDIIPAMVPSPENLDEAIKQCREAAIYFQRAYELAPREFEVLVRCGQYRSYSNWQAMVIQQFRTDPQMLGVKQRRDILGMFFSSVARQDFERALAVRPQSYQLITILAFVEWSQVLSDAQRPNNSEPPTLDELPEKSKQAVVGYLQRLKILSDGPDKKVAAAALTSMYICRMQLADSADDFTSELQRAVGYDPANEQAWDMLIGAAAGKVSPEKLTEICERRLKAKQSARNHLILAKALYKQKRFKEAVDQTEASQKVEPEYPAAAIMRLALAIRQEATPKELSSLTKTAQPLIKKLTNEKEKREVMREYFLNFAIVCGLAGESALGRELLERLLKNGGEDEIAREILNALP